MGSVGFLDSLPWTPDWGYVYANEGGIIPKYMLLSRLCSKSAITIYTMKVNRDMTEGVFNAAQSDYIYSALPWATQAGLNLGLPTTIVALSGPAGLLYTKIQAYRTACDVGGIGRDVYYLFADKPVYAKFPEEKR